MLFSYPKWFGFWVIEPIYLFEELILLMRMTFYPWAKKNVLVVQEFEKELLVYDLIENKAFVMNETCAKVFQFRDGKTSLGELKAKSNFIDEIFFCSG